MESNVTTILGKVFYIMICLKIVDYLSYFRKIKLNKIIKSLNLKKKNKIQEILISFTIRINIWC